MSKFAQYQGNYPHIRLERNDQGVLLVQFHSEGHELGWGPHVHEEVAECLGMVGDDIENRAVVITGTGSEFIDRFDTDNTTKWLSSRTNSVAWRDMVHTGYRLIRNHLDIDVPVIAAVNGPASIHAEQALLADIVICSDTSYFQDKPHIPLGLTPGDGVHIIFPALLGPNRGRHFLLTGEKIAAEEALRLGLVAEVKPQEEVLPRAMEFANRFAEMDEFLMRHTRLVLIQELRLKFQSLLPAGLAWEAFAGCASSETVTEQFSDFVEK